MEHWISVNDSLPTEYDYVIVSYVDNEGLRYIPAIGYIRNGVWYIEREIEFHRIVTHWMPLPSPPK